MMEIYIAQTADAQKDPRALLNMIEKQKLELSHLQLFLDEWKQKLERIIIAKSRQEWSSLSLLLSANGVAAATTLKRPLANSFPLPNASVPSSSTTLFPLPSTTALAGPTKKQKLSTMAVVAPALTMATNLVHGLGPSTILTTNIAEYLKKDKECRNKSSYSAAMLAKTKACVVAPSTQTAVAFTEVGKETAAPTGARGETSNNSASKINPKNSPISTTDQRSKQEQTKEKPSFPRTVYRMLEDAMKVGSAHTKIISWEDGGRGFKIWDPKMFSEVILPKYSQGGIKNEYKYRSFQRQLNIYEFKMNKKTGVYSHERFYRGCDVIGLKQIIRPIPNKNLHKNLYHWMA